MGQKQTSENVQMMSALPPKADIAERDQDVRFVPKPDIQEFGFHQNKNPETLPRVLSFGA
jgi:hypothetical protein